MNRRLVICLLAALLVGLSVAIWTVSAGWHPLLALAAYSLSGSISLVAFTFLMAWHRARPPAATADRLRPLPEPQST